MKSVVDLAKQPFYALREAISKVIKSVRAVVKRIKQTLIAIKRLVLSIRKCEHEEANISMAYCKNIVHMSTSNVFEKNRFRKILFLTNLWM